METLTLSKETIQRILSKFPDEIDVYKFIDHVILNAKVELGQKQIERGEFITDEELKAEIEQWFKDDSSK